MKRYFDAAATTPLDPRVIEVMDGNKEVFGNENSKHFRGLEARKKFDNSLKTIADILGVPWSQLCVTYSGTDGNRRLLWEARKRFGHENLYASAVEHSSIGDEVLDTNKFDPLGDGSDIPSSAKFISLMAANSETGTVFSAGRLRSKFPDAFIHRDYVQAVGKKPIDFDHADAITFTPHKFYGPKMVGLLWLKNPQLFPALSKDSHTKNVALVAGMAKAFELMAAGRSLGAPNLELSDDYLRIAKWQNQIEQFITDTIPESKIRHQDKPRIPGVINVSFKGLRGGELSQILSEQEQISVSTGSACTSDILQPTEVIKFFESDPDWQFPIRVSLHKFLDDDAVVDFCEILAHYVQTLRSRS